MDLGFKDCGLLQYDYGWNSWYFNVPDAPIVFDEVSFSVPDTAYSFVNCPSSVEPDGTIRLDMKQLRYKDLFFYLVVKRWYDSHRLEIDDVKCHLLLSKRDSVRNEEQIAVPLSHLPDAYIAKRKEEVRQWILSLNRMFPDSEAKNFTVLEDNLQSQNEKYAFGRAVHIGNGEHAVFVDRSFWGTTSLVHELVHCYLNYNYDQMAERYFFDESLIEYFANYAFYPDSDARDKAFEEKEKYYSNLPGDQDFSIFTIGRNQVDTQSGAGTWGVVYYKVPVLIHRFAKQIGEEKFFEAIGVFNRLIEQGEQPDFNTLGSILQNMGVPEQEWAQFGASL